MTLYPASTTTSTLFRRLAYLAVRANLVSLVMPLIAPSASRPSHYVVLKRDPAITVPMCVFCMPSYLNLVSELRDRIQDLSYYLCHVCARTTRSVALPAPVHCTHLIFLLYDCRLTFHADADVRWLFRTCSRVLLTFILKLLAAEALNYIPPNSRVLTMDNVTVASEGEFNLDEWKDALPTGPVVHKAMQGKLFFV